MLIIFKYIKANTTDELVAMCFLYLKMGSLILFYFAHQNYSIFFGVWCTLLFFFLRQPMYQGPSKLITALNKDNVYQDILGV